MTSYTIEKGVPLPPQKRGGSARYPFSEMDVGDSFAVPVPGGVDVGAFAAAIRAAGRYYAIKTGRSFSVRLVDGNKLVRAWRVT